MFFFLCVGRPHRLTQGGSSAASDVYKGKGAKVAKAKAEAVIMERKATGELDWDLEMAKGSQSSWKDEWLTVLFSIPLVPAFIPGMEEVVKNGFASLNEMPDWYQYSLGGIVAASFDVRSATKFFGQN